MSTHDPRLTTSAGQPVDLLAALKKSLQPAVEPEPTPAVEDLYITDSGECCSDHCVADVHDLRLDQAERLVEVLEGREKALREEVAENARHSTLLSDEERDLAFTDEEWADYQRLPEQGISHRHWLESAFRPKAAAREKALREEVARKIEGLRTWIPGMVPKAVDDAYSYAARIARGDEQ